MSVRWSFVIDNPFSCAVLDVEPLSTGGQLNQRDFAEEQVRGWISYGDNPIMSPVPGIFCPRFVAWESEWHFSRIIISFTPLICLWKSRLTVPDIRCRLLVPKPLVCSVYRFYPLVLSSLYGFVCRKTDWEHTRWRTSACCSLFLILFCCALWNICWTGVLRYESDGSRARVHARDCQDLPSRLKGALSVFNPSY